MGPDLTKKGQNRSVTQLAGAMWNHFPQMYEKMKQMGISFPQFTSDEMAELVAYIYFVGYFDAPVAAADKLKGKALLRERGCTECHSPEGEGETVPGKLIRLRRIASPIVLAQIMWNHSPKMSKRTKGKGISWSQLDGSEISDLMAYFSETSGAGRGDVVYSPLGNPTRGRRLFEEKKCIHCHAVFGKGGNAGPSLTAKPYNRTVIQLPGIMWNHALIVFEKMEREGVQKPRIAAGEMADVVAYLFFLGYFDQPGNLIKGKELFANIGCVTCHTVRGEGGKVGPDLTKYSSGKEPLQPVLIIQSMWSHAPLMAKAMEEKQITWPQFKNQDVDDLMAYIRGTGKTN